MENEEKMPRIHTEKFGDVFPHFQEGGGLGVCIFLYEWRFLFAELFFGEKMGISTNISRSRKMERSHR